MAPETSPQWIIGQPIASRRKVSIILFALLAIGYCAKQNAIAQSRIHGKVADEKGKPLKDINVLLLRQADSALVKGMISSDSGKYAFENIAAGRYLLSYSFTGMARKVTAVETLPGKHDVDQGTVTITALNKELKEATVTAKKPLFELKIDRMVINVKGSITDVGGSALDVLEKSPGVVVDKLNNSITILGKSGVVVMINNKITYMPMEAVMQLLAGTSASNIEKIELITTPPAKYDAEGNAGYINIVMVSNPQAGLNGSYFISPGYDRRETFWGGLNFNYRQGEINFYGDLAVSRFHGLQIWNNERRISNPGNFIDYNSNSNRDFVARRNNVSLGLDYQADSTNVLGVLLSGYITHWTMVAHNDASEQKNGVVDSMVHTIDNEVNNWQNIWVNLNFQHTFKPKQVLYLDANYIYYRDNNPNSYANNYYDGANNFLFEQDTRSGKVTPIHIKVFSADYRTGIGNKITLETGGKISLSRFSNDVSVQVSHQNVLTTDSALSANYLLKENIGAAYASFTADLTSKVSVKAGLRYEYTTSNLGTTETANIVDRKYGELFPTFYISDKLSAANSINFSYNRRITRPSFNDLAPWTIFLDPKTYETGNPALQPAIANTVEVSYLLKDYSVSLSYTREDNTIGYAQSKIDTSNNIQYISAFNYKYARYLSMSFALPTTITKWWNMQNNITGGLYQITAVENGLPIRNQTFNININSTQRFVLPASFSAELTVYYRTTAINGTQRLSPHIFRNYGLQKKFKNNRDVLRFSAYDQGGKFSFVDNIATRNTMLKGYFLGYGGFNITYTHNFGKNTVKGKRDRTTGAEDETNRVHS